MLPQRILQSAARRGVSSARAPALRSGIRRRFASAAEEQPKLSGAKDNAFNRERAAVKAHAAATSGQQTPSPSLLKHKHATRCPSSGPTDADVSADLWRKLSI
jgi:hypothetical protein